MCKSFVSSEQLNRFELDHIWEYVTTDMCDSSLLKGVAVTLLFQQPSTRTALAFMKAASDLGALPYLASPGHLRLASGESLDDTIETLTTILGGLLIVRAPVETKSLSERATIINAGDNSEHPSQSLVDLLSIAEHSNVTSLEYLPDFRLLVLAGSNALCRPIVSLLHLLKIVENGHVQIVFESTDDASQFSMLADTEQCEIVAVASNLKELGEPNYLYILESYDQIGRLRSSPWLRSAVELFRRSIVLHPLPKSASTTEALKGRETLIEAQLALHVRVKRAVLSWVMNN